MLVEALLVACCALTGVTSTPGNSASDDDSIGAKVLDLELSLDWPDTPPYVESLKTLVRIGEALKEFLPHEELRVTDPRRHFVLFAGVLACVVEYLNSDCSPPDYEHEYLPAVDVLLPVVWQNPSAAVVKLESFVMDSKKNVQQIQELVDTHCHKIRASVCNRVLQADASDSDDLDEPLNLLILIGDLAAIYEKNRYADEAANYKSVGLLLGGQEKLKPLVFKAAEVYNKLYGRHCEP